MKKRLLYPLLFLMPLAMQAQGNLEVEGNATLTGTLTSSGAFISGNSPVRIYTTATSVLDLRANNPLIEFRDNSATYLAFLQHFGTDLYLANREAGSLFFRTSNLNRLTINSAGNVGIGNTAPASKLTVNGLENNGTVAGLEVYNGSQKTIMDGNEIDCTSGALHLNYNSLNDLLVRTTISHGEITMAHNNGSGVANGFTLLHPGSNNAYWTMYTTNGNGHLEFYYQGSQRSEINSTTGAYVQISDRNLKENIRPLDDVLSRVRQLKPSVYNFKHDPKRQSCLGFLAQDVMEVFPEVVTKSSVGDSDQEVFMMDYSALGVIALAAVQELAQEKSDHQALLAENRELKAQIETLEARITRLEKLAAKQ